MDELNLKPGKWLFSNCADMPSEKNCQMVMMAPANQREDFLDAAVAHAVKTHGHEESDELRKELEGMIKEIEIK